MNRRHLLRAVGLAVGVGVAGCDTISSTPTNPSSPTPTRTPADDKAPTIRSYGATPEQNGTVLAVSMEGEDNRGLAKAQIVYSDREVVRQPDSPTVTINDNLEDTAETSPPDGRVAYLLTDAAGNETRKYAQPDRNAPDLTLETRPTARAGEAVLAIIAEDDTGLAELHTLLNGKITATHDVRNHQNYSDERTVTVPEKERGRRVSIGAQAQDWNHSTTEKENQTYVRKYNLLEDTRLDFSAQYQPFFNEFKNFDMKGRKPSVGQYEDVPYPQWIYERHLDQMSGFGVTSVRIEVLDTREESRARRGADAFLKSGLLAHVDVGVHYGIAGHLWLEDGDFLVDDYRTELIEPHMQYIRDNILSRDNAATHDGRPVMDIWNPEVWLWDYPRGRIMNEWGSYEALIDDIRSHLTIDGTNPFLVGGFNDWGRDGIYSKSDPYELATQFDGVSTWVGGGAWGDDHFATQDEVLAFVERNWQGHRKFVDEHDMEFIPMVFPGFNEVKDPQRRTPRSPEFFAELLQLADKYRTTDMVWTPPYNNWEEATHYEPGVFEPGPFGEEDYGTAYLEKVKQFQQGELG